MAHYFGIASRLRLKKDAPVELLNMLDWLYRLEGSEDYQISLGEKSTGHSKKIEEMMESLHDALGSGCKTLETWDWKVREDKGDHWLYENRSGHRHNHEQEFLSLLHGIRDYLILEEGDILFRSIYEESVKEDIIFFTKDAFAVRGGYEYSHDNGYVTDWEHPFVDEEDKKTAAMYAGGELKRTQRPPDYNELFWTVQELDADANKKKLREDRLNKVARGRGHGGYGGR
jgi:hypothetical protein